MSIYDFTVTTNKGEEKSLADYKGKVILIVNTASKCGFTPQYDDLQALYKDYESHDLVILGFPCNQFGEQEPENDEGIEQFCRLNHGVKFPLFAKGDVRGETAHPLFKYLVSQKGFKGFDKDHPIAERLQNALNTKFPEYLEGDDIKWNFTKFLIDKYGQVVERFEPTASNERLRQAVEDLL